MSSTMTEEQILADLEAFDKEDVSEVKGTSAQKALISPAPDTQTDKGEVPAEKTGGIEDAGKENATAGTEPEEPIVDKQGRLHDPKTGRILPKPEEQLEKAGEPSPA